MKSVTVAFKSIILIILLLAFFGCGGSGASNVTPVPGGSEDVIPDGGGSENVIPDADGSGSSDGGGDGSDGGGGIGPHPVDNVRSFNLRFPYRYPIGEDLVVGAEMRYSVRVGGDEDELNMPKRDLVEKVEFDPGDGSGWVDFTQSYLGNLHTNSPVGSHVYTEPGDYRARARVTFWDGEVLETTRAGYPRTLPILPAPDGGE